MCCSKARSRDPSWTASQLQVTQIAETLQGGLLLSFPEHKDWLTLTRDAWEQVTIQMRAIKEKKKKKPADAGSESTQNISRYLQTALSKQGEEGFDLS